MYKFLLLLLFTSHIGLSQSNLVEQTITSIELKEDTIRSVFDWVAENIKYDVSKLEEISNPRNRSSQPTFKSEEEYLEYSLQQVIKQKKGVCEDYSLLFDALVRALGYESCIIEGYTKKPNGKLVKSLGHQWNAVKVNKQWKLFEPTWAAGYIDDNNKFVKKYNPIWYDVDSKQLIKTHMPYDPVWQLSDHVIRYKDFEESESPITSGGDYDFNRIIEEARDKDLKTQLQDQLNRSAEMGDGLRLIDKWRKRLTQKINLFGITDQIELLNESNKIGISAVDLFNKYMTAKSKRFQGNKWSIEKAREYLEESKTEILAVMDIYNSLDINDRKATSVLNRSKKQAENLLDRIDSEFVFLEKL